MNLLLAIAGGGAVGALARYWLSDWVYDAFGRTFPYGTLAVNVVGSLLMGVFYIWLTEKTSLAPEWRAVIVVGFLGAFTTFSTFSLETLHLLESGELLKAASNVILSVVLCVVAVSVGVVLGRQL